VLEACSRHLLDKTSPRNGSTTPPENRPTEKSHFNIEFFNTIGQLETFGSDAKISRKQSSVVGHETTSEDVL
jgi:hypothetical protein